MASKPWYHKGLRFECTQCGDCCRNHGDYAFVYVTSSEVDALAAHLGVERQAFLDRWCVVDDDEVCLRMDAPACPFLSEEGRCEVYPVRPKQCATWPFWSENLRQEVWEGPVKDCCPGIGEGALHPAEQVRRVAAETEAWYANPDDRVEPSELAPRAERPAPEPGG